MHFHDEGQIKKRLEQIEQEIGRYVKALGQGKLSIGRLEAEISALEAHKQALQKQYDDLQRKINEAAVRDYNAEILQRTLQGFRSVFYALTPQEQSEALQCVLRAVTVYPQKLDLEIFELAEFYPGSQKGKEWLRGLDSNQDNQIQSLVCYRLHHPGTAAASATILIDYARFCDRFFFLLLADLPRGYPFWAARHSREQHRQKIVDLVPPEGSLVRGEAPERASPLCATKRESCSR
jgi:hypothetical protein